MNNDIPQLQILLIKSLDPAHNLVLERRLFERLQPNQCYILLWQNSDAVVIGRAQNPWFEVNLNYTSLHNIPVLRRHSGGGAVFNDHGNINFTFMAHKPFYDRNIISQVVNQLLLSLGLNTCVNDRNDILLKMDNQLYKVSGSAYQETITKGLHHATLLVNSDLHKLRKALKPRDHNLVIKGITSTRSSVANLCDANPSLTTDNVLTKLISHFQHHFSVPIIRELDVLSEAEIDSIALNKQISWEWNFGGTPPFMHLLDGALLGHEIKGELRVNKGIIETIHLSTHLLDIEKIEKIKNMLLQCRYQLEAIKERFNTIQLSDNNAEDIALLINWISSEID